MFAAEQKSTAETRQKLGLCADCITQRPRDLRGAKSILKHQRNQWEGGKSRTLI